MHLPSAQDAVLRFVETHHLEVAVPYRLIDLASEVGELAKEALEATSYDRAPFEPTEGWPGELADALFSLICLANSTGVDLQAALAAALEKYERRLETTGDAGSGS